VVYFITSASVKRYAGAQKKLDYSAMLVRESLSGARVIRAFSKQEDTNREFADSTEELYASQKRAMRLSSAMNPLTLAVVNAGIILILHFGSRTVYTGGVTQGEIIALTNYMTQMFVALVMLANLVVTATRAIASSKRILGLLNEEPTLTYGDETDIAGDSIAFEGVAYSYEEGSNSAIEADFEIGRGEFIGVLGTTGSGKTTLVRLLMRGFDPRRGVIRLFGRDMRSYSKEALTGIVSVVPQRAEVFSATVRENVALGRDYSDEDIIAALKTAQAWDFVNDMGGLDSHISAGGKNLSGGQKQRLTIARALLGKPELLLLDDAVSALDYMTERELLSQIRKNFSTVILVTQRTSSLAGADRIMVLKNGRVAGFASHDELCATCEEYRSIYDMEHEEDEAL
ncbi:MAG: ABC transporter ATP-binding protein, partial [Clostridia bacterium]|nr:ABC transporter ATP-binding protein [Clostridia bacterium]